MAVCYLQPLVRRVLGMLPIGRKATVITENLIKLLCQLQRKRN
jgi:hypothetical protein